MHLKFPLAESQKAHGYSSAAKHIGQCNEEEAGAETVTPHLMSSDIHSKFRQLTAYLQLSAEGPFSACGRTLETYARHVKTPGFSPQTMMDGEWVDKGPSAFVCQLDNSVSQGDPTGKSPVTQTVASLLIHFFFN